MKTDKVMSILYPTLTGLAYVALIATFGVYRIVGSQPPSLAWTALIVGSGVLVVILPSKEALAVDLFSVALLAIIQIEVAYTVNGLGSVWSMFTSLVGWAIPAATAFALIILFSRIRLSLIPRHRRPLHQVDEFYASRVSSACTASVGAALMSGLAVWFSAGWLGASVTLMSSVAIIFLSVGAFLTIWVADVSRRWVLRRSWESHGYAARIEGCEGFPEYVVREAKRYEEGIEIAQNRRGLLAFGTFGLLSLTAYWVSGPNAIVFIIVALGIVLIGMMIVGWKDRTNRRERWYQWVEARGEDKVMFREVSRRTSLGWPDEEP